MIDPNLSLIELTRLIIKRGGPTSGNFKHRSIKGKHGGSAPGGGHGRIGIRAGDHPARVASQVGKHRQAQAAAGGGGGFSAQKTLAGIPSSAKLDNMGMTLHLMKLENEGKLSNDQVKQVWNEYTKNKQAGQTEDGVAAKGQKVFDSISNAENLSPGTFAAILNGKISSGQIGEAEAQEAQALYTKMKKDQADELVKGFQAQHAAAAAGHLGVQRGHMEMVNSPVGTAWTDSLTPLERNVANIYTGGAYRSINTVLRGKEGDDPLLTPGDIKTAKMRIPELKSALDKASLDQDTLVYRGLKASTAQKLLGENAADWKGKTLRDAAFQSTSIDRTTASNFSPCCPKVIMNIGVPKGYKAGYLDHISKYKGEKELLIQAGSAMKITRAEMINGNIEVFAEYVFD